MGGLAKLKDTVASRNNVLGIALQGLRDLENERCGHSLRQQGQFTLDINEVRISSMIESIEP